MFVFSLLQDLILIISIMLFSRVDGHELCDSNVPIDQESDRYYRRFQHLDNIGVLQCIKVCKRYKLCEKIHYSREQLTCDLMMTFAETGNVASLLDAKSLQMDMHGCSQATCKENEVCVNKHDDSHVCLVQDICPTTEWVPFNHKCYFFADQKTTADDNMKLCETFNATMVRVDDDAVSDFLNSEMGRREKRGIWIAANDRAVEGEWVWGPGDIVTNAVWDSGEPHATRMDFEDCVAFWPSWHDMECSEDHTSFPVCQLSYSISP